MLQPLLRFLADLAMDKKDRDRFEADDYRVAAAALMVHAALIDGAMSDGERNRIVGAIMLRFDFDEAQAKDLIAAATEAEHQAVDLYRFTSLLNRKLDEAERQQIIEMMWQVAHADGRVTEFEDNLLWRAADLLHISGQTRIELRRRVAERGTLGSRDD